jgi:hypothetical protein
LVENGTTHSADTYVQPLPDELAAALRLTTAETLASLLSLRIALRDHIRAEHADGATQAEINDRLRDMIVSAAGDPAAVSYSAERVNELTSQILKWSATFYSGKVR